ncbi:unnamed protein product [Eruca vesicaria subsp. sativa]|uniref:Uncharacterized protein n=1 Tax=Eruca vesicaria subsp. sativa TaxID=29727 RepID=A0ABC8KZW8_ERUVS|nr:unnamed protein product [Eruca vesicaria subsp. sativa]
MDSGLSWADQWDTNPDPPQTCTKEDEGKKKTKKKKDEDGSIKSLGKNILGFQWMKDLRKKK